MDSKEIMERNKLIAEVMLTKHNPGCKSGGLNRENCAGCALNGYMSRETRAELKKEGIKHPIINYAGWLRVYLQAGKHIPKKLKYAAQRELETDNILYLEAIKEDAKYFGVKGDEEILKLFKDKIDVP